MKILEQLTYGLDIVYNQVITQIDHSKDTVVVTTKDGIIYEANKVIVTVPLAVLKAEDIKFFPSLSDEKMKSINALGISKMDKLIIEFEHAFWDHDIDWFNYVAETPGDWA